MLGIKWVLGVIVILALLTSSGVPFLVSTSPAVAEGLSQYVVGTTTDEEGNEIVGISVPGRPPEVKMAAVDPPEPNPEMGINILTDIPAFDWCYGCSATSAAMLFGHYDRTGYSNMYAGPTNGGVCPLTNSAWGSGECSLSATHMGYDGLGVYGHVDDYWDSYGSTVDPYYGNWPEHGYADCTADFMGTNQYHNWQNTDGSTIFFYYTDGSALHDYTGAEPSMRDGCHGARLFAESRGYTVIDNYNQWIYGYQGNTLGFTFAQYVAEIDAGRPVLIHIEGHTMLGFGYNTTGEIVYIHDTWDHSDHTMVWGGEYAGSPHYMVTVIELAAPALPDIWVTPDSFFDITLPPDTFWSDTLEIGNSGGATLTYDITDTLTMSPIVIGDGAEISPPPESMEIIERGHLIELEPSEPVSILPVGLASTELAYDDGTAENAVCFGGPGGRFAVCFTPPGYPVELNTARICLPVDWPDTDHEMFAVEVYDDDGGGGAPGTQLGTTVYTTATSWGWWDVDISGLGITITGGNFYIAYHQLTTYPDCEGLCLDETSPDGRSWMGAPGSWDLISNQGLSGDWMLRCVVAPPAEDCPWLDESPPSGSVTPASSDSITVSIDTTGLALGDYGADIIIANNDPDEDPTVVPVTLTVGVGPTEVWVDDNYCDGCGNDGHTWGYDAFDSIQDGINAVTGSTVHVADGTYYENITLVDGVAVLGAGEGLSIINGGASGSVVTAIGVGATTQLSGFTITNGSAAYGGGMHNSSSSAVISNCTFSVNTASLGGGMFNYESSPTVTNCTFVGNLADDGAGMYNISNSSPTLTDCTFATNTAIGYGGGMFNYSSSPTLNICTFSGNSANSGGAMLNFNYSSPALTTCTFTGNPATNYAGGMYNVDNCSPVLTDCDFLTNTADSGGAMFNYDSTPTMDICTFSGNTATYYGGAMLNCSSSPALTDCTLTGNSADYGGAIFNFSSSPPMDICTFTGNSATYGGAMCNNDGSSPTLTNCDFLTNTADNGGVMFNYNSSPPMTGCTFTGNTAVNYGGVMLNYYYSSPVMDICTFAGNSVTHCGGVMHNIDNSSPTMTNCTFWENSAIYGGGMFNYSSSSPTITNCTFYGNTATYGGAMINNTSSSPTVTNCILWNNGDEINNDGTSTPVVTYCDVEGGYGGAGNINVNPLFVNAGTGDFHLQSGSLCREAGNNAAPAIPTTDFEGDPRIVNGVVDMGVDEYVAPMAWTFMVYLDGDNNLEEPYIWNFNYMEYAANNPNVNVIVQFDRIPGFDSSNGDWTTTRRYEVKYDTDIYNFASYTLDVDYWELGELNMADPTNLSDFVSWAKTNYPAEHYFLAVVNHGGGWIPTGVGKRVPTGIVWDDTSGDYMSTAELGDALSSATSGGTEKLDVLFLDACLMQMIEVGYEVKDYSQYMVASEYYGWAPGPYYAYIPSITATTTAPQLATTIVTEYHNDLTGTIYAHTMSAVDLSQYGLASVVSDFAVALTAGLPTYQTEIQNSLTACQKFDYDNDAYIDLYHFAYLIKQNVANATIQTAAQAVMDGVVSAVIAEAHENGGSTYYYMLDNSHGISIYFPASDSDPFYSSYNGSNLEFVADKSWDEFLAAFFALS